MSPRRAGVAVAVALAAAALGACGGEDAPPEQEAGTTAAATTAAATTPAPTEPPAALASASLQLADLPEGATLLDEGEAEPHATFGQAAGTLYRAHVRSFGVESAFPASTGATWLAVVLEDWSAAPQVGPNAAVDKRFLDWLHAPLEERRAGFATRLVELGAAEAAELADVEPEQLTLPPGLGEASAAFRVRFHAGGEPAEQLVVVYKSRGLLTYVHLGGEPGALALDDALGVARTLARRHGAG